MGYFYTFVLIPKESSVNFSSIPLYIDRILAPYDSYKNVETISHPCPCVGRLAQLEAARLTEEHTKAPYKDLHYAFWSKNKKEQDEAILEKNWSFLFSEYDTVATKFLKEHPLYNKPTPKCLECRGKGVCSITENPKAKWDNYNYGGRWDGLIQGKLLKFKEEEQAEKANLLDNNIALVETLLHKDFILPYSIFEGKNWFSKEDKSWVEWRYEVLEVLKKFETAAVVGLDCHI